MLRGSTPKWTLTVVALTLLLAGCEDPPMGPQGEPGPAGADGDDGQRGSDCWDLNGNGEQDPGTEDLNGDGSVDILDCHGIPGQNGLDGEDGEDWTPATFVGSEACGDCHDEQYQRFIRSGHPYKLVQTGGLDPVEPWPAGEFGEYAPVPPDGYAWSDVEYVIGGWGWKQRFVDTDGYIVTGDAAQYNLETGEWVAYEAEVLAGTKPYDCGSCHTTGYRPDGNQGGLPGMIGTFEAGGVQCEECHGFGSQHVADPYLVDMRIDRSAELCGGCHYRTDPATIPASGGFIKHHEQWNEMFHSKKHSMDCADCHDPHQSARYADPVFNPNKSIRIACEDCHFQQEAVQNSMIMAGFTDCIDCHMPMATRSAVGDLASFTGDVRTHLFGINPYAEEQFNQAGDDANSYLTLDYACNSCHGVWASTKTHEELQQSATGYHTP